LTSNSESNAILTNGIFNYDINTTEEYSFIIESTNEPMGLNNFSNGPVGSYYRFDYITESEISYDEVYTVPIADNLILINPVTQIGE
jgi:hypothetical protein